MAPYKKHWTDFITRFLTMLPHATSDSRSTSGSNLNTQDQREYRQERQSPVGKEEVAWPEIRESLDNLR
jgi:hypothetical protein